jgi:DNA-binding transcriptional ArsR family regulator
MKAIHRISSLDEVRALSHPMRIEIVRRLDEDAKTTAQIAKEMRIKPTKLYFHMAELEKNGIVLEDRTEKKGNLTERYYRLVAKEISFDRNAFFGMGPIGREAIWQGINAVLEATGQAVRQALTSEKITENDLTALRSKSTVVRLTPKRMAEFHEKVDQLLRDADADEDQGPRALLGLVYCPLPPEDE